MDFKTFLLNTTHSDFKKSHLFRGQFSSELYTVIYENIKTTSPVECLKNNPQAFVEILISIYENIVLKNMTYSDYDTFIEYLIKHKNTYSLIESLYQFGDDELNNKLLHLISKMMTSKLFKFIYKDPVVLFSQELLEIYTQLGYSKPAIELISKYNFSNQTLQSAAVNILNYSYSSQFDREEFTSLILLINSKMNDEYLYKTYILFIDSMTAEKAVINNLFYSTIFYDFFIKIKFTHFSDTVLRLVGIILLNNQFNENIFPFMEQAFNKEVPNLQNYLQDSKKQDFYCFMSGLFNNKEASLRFFKTVYPSSPSLFSLYAPFFDFDVFSTIFPLFKETDLTDLVYVINKKHISIQQTTSYIQSIYKLADLNKSYYVDFFKTYIKIPEIIEMITLDYEMQNF